MTDLLQRVEENIQGRKLFERGERILVAVSGGLDSMTLLQTLDTLAKKNHWKLFAAHFNHQLRGRSSDADEKLVCKTAKKLKLPIVVGRADVKAFAKKSRLSIEMAARKLRHEFFARLARERKIKTVTLAHHADDQVELFLLRLLRGAGGEGLSGMKWRSQSPAGKKISLVRPLLDFSKSELTDFARENKIQFREDATNFSLDFLRNRIRNELLPLLRKKYQPGLGKMILRLMEIIGAESNFVDETAKKSFAKKKKDFEKLPLAIQRRILQSQLIGLGVVADFELVEQLRTSARKPMSVGSDLSVLRDANGVVKLRSQSVIEFSSDELALDLSGGAEEVIFGGANLKWSFVADKKFKRKRNKTNCEFFDADKIGNKIVLRHWRVGDRFRPIGLKSAAKLQDLFTNAKIPRARRHHLILATTSTGEIFWVEGLRISENFKIAAQTKRRLIWRWQSVD